MFVHILTLYATLTCVYGVHSTGSFKKQWSFVSGTRVSKHNLMEETLPEAGRATILLIVL